MAVQITWKESAVAITSLNHGSVAAGGSSTIRTLTIEHDGENQITNCRFWIDTKSGAYGGGATPAADLAEMLEWGDALTAAGFGGLKLNMDAAAAFPVGKWPSYSDKYGSDYSAFYTGRGDTADNGVLLHINMNSTPIMPANGVIPASCTTWPSFACRIEVPTSEGTTGVRQFEHKLRFTYTS